jgi:hypothetical protein
MELEVLKKRISSYRTEGGRLTRLSDELVMEILVAWEQWTGPASGFYTAVGVDHRKLASVIGRGKKLKREGHFPVEEFKEIKVEGSGNPCNGIEVAWENGRLIRFQHVEQLIDFLKKVA